MRTKHGLDRIHLVKFIESNDACQDVLDLIKQLEQDSNIEYAEPSIQYELLKTTNDPLYSSGVNHLGLWNLEKTKVGSAWDYARGGGVKVAVIDSSTDITHPDLSSNIYDGSLNFPLGVTLPAFHGTHVSGTIVATGNNNRGIVGAAYESKLIPIGIFKQGSQVIPLASVVYAAVNAGAGVINISAASTVSNQTDNAAFEYAYDSGVLVIAAAGNSNLAPLPFIGYPAAYRTVLAISATDENDQRANFSNYGDWIDVAAPGTHILSITSRYTCTPSECTQPVVFDDQIYGYALSDGTSMSAPLVSGIAALLKSYWTRLTIDQIYRAIIYGVDKINTDAYIGSGRVNAYNSIIIATYFKSRWLLNPNLDDTYTDAELSSFITRQKQAAIFYSADFDMNNDGFINQADTAIIDSFINQIPGLATRITTLRNGSNNNGGNTAGESTEPVLVSASVFDDFIPGNVTNRGRTVVKFTVTASGTLNQQTYLPTASNLTLGGLPVKAVEGTVGQFIGIINFANPNGKILKSVAGTTSSSLNLTIPINLPVQSGAPSITSIQTNRKGQMIVKGRQLKSNGYFGFVLSDGSFQRVSLRSPKANQQSSVSSISVSTNTLFALYSLQGRGVDIFEF